ncbi:tail fiber assembly protein [Enterobacter asburiae]|uniref:tail fiber assembly protein n=1 Tax=Enterobacter asburiae TaxID=61645 RepID=UPI0005EFCC3B|nr:tail assembly chaperone [Enterobacter asburiae]ELW9468678.1 tail assembly chaperone [Enterobacter asburiae]KJP19805.1 hypothetical protein SR74_10115 [Enterobacter asburiae]MDU4084802.1 tail assembly chaperone [Enterobacter asburiae]QLV57605.1 tail assembly chaperone [Enterobacter asburiae]QLV61597.1 tail assembly chaperone [Enterobacter asburiae]
MNNYVYSSKNNAFYAVLLKEAYEMAGSWPDDGVKVTDAIFLEYTASAPEGKLRCADNDGYPAWTDIPPQTPEQLQEQAEKERQRLLNYASSITEDWRTELALGIIGDEDKAKLTAWMAYIKDVKAIPVSVAIEQGFSWPNKPA